MALPSPKFYTSTGGEITTHDFGSCEAGAYKPGSTGWSFRLYNDYDGSLGSDTMTSVKVSIRDDDGGTDEVWTQQHWVQIKSDGCSTGSIVDDAQTVFTAVGKNKELSLGDIPSGEYRTLYARCYPPTDATEQNVDFQLRVTYQQPATSICNWITGLRGNGVVATTGDPFAMSTGSTGSEIDYKSGYALIDNNEVYYGSSGTYDIATTGSGSYTIYLTESGAFGETTGSPASNQLALYDATISSGTCTALSDRRVYISGLQAGSTDSRPSTPDKGDLYFDIINGNLYGAKTSTGWTQINSTGAGATTFVGLTDTPASFSSGASKILTITTGEDAVEFTSSTGIKLDDLGTPDDNTDLNATTGHHGLLPKFSGTTGEYLSATGGWDTPAGTETFLGLTDTPADYIDDANKFVRVNSSSDSVEFVSATGIALDTFGTPTDITDNNASTGHHGLLLKLDGNTSNYLRGDGAWQPPPGSSGGEANTASNSNTTGVGVYYQKSGIDLQFKGIRANSSKVTVTDSTGTHTISLDLAGVLTSSGAFTTNTIPQISSTGGVLKASPFAVTTGDVFNFGAHSAGFTEQAIATTTGTVAINWNNGNKALYTRSTGTAGGAATFTFTAPVNSMNLMLIIQGSTAGCTGAVTLPTAYWGNATYPTFSSGVSAIDAVALYYSTGLTSYLGIGSANFSTV